MKNHFFILCPLSLLLIFTSCGTPSLVTGSWKADTIQARHYNKIVVLSLIRENNPELRQKMEQHIATGLVALGYDAICSCEEYNTRAFENMTEEQAVAKLKKGGVSAVLTVVLLDKTSEKIYISGDPVNKYHPKYTRFFGYYKSTAERIFTPGYYVENTKYYWESNFYDLGSNEVIYSAQSRSFDPVSTEKMGQDYGQMLLKDMLKQKVVEDRSK